MQTQPIDGWIHHYLLWYYLFVADFYSLFYYISDRTVLLSLEIPYPASKSISSSFSDPSPTNPQIYKSITPMIYFPLGIHIFSILWSNKHILVRLPLAIYGWLPNNRNGLLLKICDRSDFRLQQRSILCFWLQNICQAQLCN